MSDRKGSYVQLPDDIEDWSTGVTHLVGNLEGSTPIPSSISNFHAVQELELNGCAGGAGRRSLNSDNDTTVMDGAIPWVDLAGLPNLKTLKIVASSSLNSLLPTQDDGSVLREQSQQQQQLPAGTTLTTNMTISSIIPSTASKATTRWDYTQPYLSNLETLEFAYNRNFTTVPGAFIEAYLLRRVETQQQQQQQPQETDKGSDLDSAEAERTVETPAADTTVINSSLKHLKIRFCKSFQQLSPAIGQLIRLQTLEFRHCDSLAQLHLSPTSQACDGPCLPNLQSLIIDHCLKLSSLPLLILSTLPRLKRLEVAHCPHIITLMLPHLDTITIDNNIEGNLVYWPTLESIRLESLCKLQDLPFGLLHLDSNQHYQNRSRRIKAFPKLQQVQLKDLQCLTKKNDNWWVQQQQQPHERLRSNDLNTSSVSPSTSTFCLMDSSPSLTLISLALSHCNALTEIPPETFVHKHSNSPSMPLLEELTISNCLELIQLPIELFLNLKNLKTLQCISLISCRFDNLQRERHSDIYGDKPKINDVDNNDKSSLHLYLPRLEVLVLQNLPYLSRLDPFFLPDYDNSNNDNGDTGVWSNLQRLQINHCPGLFGPPVISPSAMIFPRCIFRQPNLQELSLSSMMIYTSVVRFNTRSRQLGFSHDEEKARERKCTEVLINALIQGLSMEPKTTTKATRTTTTGAASMLTDKRKATTTRHSLQRLSLQDCLLTGEDLGRVWKTLCLSCPNLTHLFLARNKIDTLVPLVARSKHINQTNRNTYFDRQGYQEDEPNIIICSRSLRVLHLGMIRTHNPIMKVKTPRRSGSHRLGGGGSMPDFRSRVYDQRHASVREAATATATARTDIEHEETRALKMLLRQNPCLSCIGWIPIGHPYFHSPEIYYLMDINKYHQRPRYDGHRADVSGSSSDVSSDKDVPIAFWPVILEHVNLHWNDYNNNHTRTNSGRKNNNNITTTHHMYRKPTIDRKASITYHLLRFGPALAGRGSIAS